MAKKKKVYQSTKKLDCIRCGLTTTHSLFDHENRIWKCNVCDIVYVPKNKR